MEVVLGLTSLLSIGTHFGSLEIKPGSFVLSRIKPSLRTADGLFGGAFILCQKYIRRIAKHGMMDVGQTKIPTISFQMLVRNANHLTIAADLYICTCTHSFCLEIYLHMYIYVRGHK